MVFTTEGFFQVVMGSWAEWDMDPRQLNSCLALLPTKLSGHNFNSYSQPTLYSCSNFNFFLAFRFHFDHFLHQSPHSFNGNLHR